MNDIYNVELSARNSINKTNSIISLERKKSLKICVSCGIAINGKFIRALGEIYHCDCFRCIDCNEVCTLKYFPCCENGIIRPLCETDYFRRLNLICAKCGGALRGPYINASNKKYHVDHFTCAVCDIAFQPNDSYFEHNNKIYCKVHYSALFSNCCHGCQTPILKLKSSGGIDTQEKWHPECYLIYTTWNVKLKLKKDIPIDLIDTSFEKQKLIEEKIARIWSILSSFEKSSANCMAEILAYVSKNKFLNGIEKAGNLICHVDVLFSGVDEIENKLKKFNDETGLQHTKEPKILAKRIVEFFSIFTHRNSFPRQDPTQEFLTLASTLANTFKILIRFALEGALKLENVYNDSTAIDSFLVKFIALEEMQSELQQHLMISDEYNIRSEYCSICRNTIEEECIKLNDCRWHAECFICQVCKKDLYKTYNEEARMDLTNKSLYCKECSPLDTVDGFVYVTSLEQYIFLIKISFKKIIQNRYK